MSVPAHHDEVDPAATQAAGLTRLARSSRLADEYARLAEAYAFHPAVKVIPLTGEPTDTYQVEFHVRTVTIESATGKLGYVDHLTLVIALGADFPAAPPVVHPPAELFLPNSDGERLQFAGAWRSGESLVDLIPRLGELLACRTYDPESVINPEALEWQEANVKSLPTDKAADFTPTGGKETRGAGAGKALTPRDRIARFGAARIAEVRRVLQTACVRLAEGQIDPDAIRDTAVQARFVLLPLLGHEVDPAVVKSARELSTWADALASNLPEWYALRDRRTRLAAAQRAIDGLAAADKPLSDCLAEMVGMFPGQPAAKAAKALVQIPLAEAIQPILARLSAALAGAIQQEALARKAVAEFADFDISTPTPASGAAPVAATPNPATASRHPGAPGWPPDPPADSPMTAILAERQSAVGAESEAVAARAGPAIEEAAELVRRGRAETTALQRLADWRDYLDQFAIGSAIASDVIQRGSAGVQAYILEVLKTRHGPFQFEQLVTFGNAQLATAHDGSKLQIIDIRTGEVLGHRKALAMSIRLSANGADTTLTVRATATCSAIADRLDSCRQHTFDTLSRLHETVPESQTWAGRLLEVLCTPSALAALHAEHRRSTHRWEKLAVDLLQLGPLKDRLATHYLLKRTLAALAGFAEKRAAIQKKVAEANERLAALAARCGRDPGTDKLLIPPQLASVYAAATADREKAIKELHRLDHRQIAVGEYLAQRLLDPARIGRCQIPAFRRLPALPPELLQAAAAATDAALSAAVAELADRLGMQFAPVVAAEAPDLSNRRREKRPAPAAPADPDDPSDAADRDHPLAARPEDSIADLAVAEDEE